MKKGRFAPSPTGELHLGNAFTAVLAWLQMRCAGGAFILRIEDIDKGRARAHYAKQMLADLRWLGLDWDEGPDVGGAYGPYYQQARTGRYEDALRELSEKGRLYPCFCRRAQLVQVAAAPHGLFADEPIYPGTCRHLTAAQQQARAREKTPSLRFAVPDMSLSFDDLAAGPMQVDPRMGGDFIVRRADGLVSYQLAVVVDDAAMGITDVLRGRDLLASTPRQLLLYQALGLQPPRFTHVPLVLAANGARLAKRNRSITLAAMREAGVSPAQVVGVIAYLAKLQDTPEPVLLSELVARFDVARLPRTDVCLTPECMKKLAIQ